MSVKNNQTEHKEERLQRLRRRAEERLHALTSPVELSEEEKEHLIEELRIHQVELEMQNEELRQVQEQIDATRAEYEDLWANSPFAYLLLDRAGRIAAVNLQGRILLGRTGERLMEERFSTLVEEQDQVAVQMLLEKTWEAGFSGLEEVRIPRPDETFRVCRISCRNMKTRADRIQAVMTDITESRRLEQSLLESQQRLALAVEGGRLGTWDRDLTSEEVVVDRKIYEFLGRNPEKILRGRDEFFAYVHGDDQDRVLRNAAAVLAKGSDYFDEYRIVREDGEIRWLASVAKVYRDAAGKPLRMTGINYDITERKQAEEMLRTAQIELERQVAERTAELQEANEELSKRTEQLARLSSELVLTEARERRRLAGILHDNLQQYLVGAKMHLEVLISRTGDKDKGRLQNAHDMIAESLRISQSLTAELSPLILEQQGLIAALQWLARWMNEKHDLEVEVDAGPEANVFREDVALLLFQSVRELLFNVVKHAQTRRARVTLDGDGKQRLEITVADQGVGFRPEKEQISGTGFGLFSIRERLELMGGCMKLSSSPGRGTEVRLVAPVAEDVIGKEEKTLKNKVSPMMNVSSRKVRLLLADDHTVLRQSLASMLELESDLEIVGEAADGEEAVQLAEKLKPDVILMDITMPKMDGVQATRIIHASQPDIRIIGLSMHERADQARLMIEAGAADYCTKSGDTEDLLKAIHGR